MIHTLCLLFAIVFTTAGQLLFKEFTTRKKKPVLFFAILCFVLTPLCAYGALRGFSIDIVYMATSITIALVMAGARVFLHEPLSGRQLASAGLIILGVIIYNLPI